VWYLAFFLHTGQPLPQVIASALPKGNGFSPISSDLLTDVFEFARMPFNRKWGTIPNSYSKSDWILFQLSDFGASIRSAEDAYFRLHLMSNRMVKPNAMSLDGLFWALPNVAWTSEGPVLPEDVSTFRLETMAAGKQLTVTHVDKFPYMVNYVVPPGVRIASGTQVRLGAYLGEGTTVMPAGFVNFNAGSEGKAMIEGRVSAGVFLGDGTDIGGGASIMGTLSGGNAHVVSIGAACLLGANAGVGISLGFGCTVEAGLYVTAGTIVALYNRESAPVDLNGQRVNEGQNLVKARDLSGRDHMLLMRHSQTGQVICRPNPRTISLNSQLHAN
jgi:2,3,4,5-tetrahydropyridine-2-carboxylate N-succinyltransferase